MSAQRILAAVALVAAVVLVALAASGASPYVVRAEFPNASGLRADFRVTIGGVPVGKVTAVTLSPRDTAVATMELDKGAGPLGRDAMASIKPTNLLGEKVVVLAPGDLRRPAPSGTTIPVARTSTPVELDDVLNTLDSDTRTALAVFLAEQGNALVGRTGDLAAALDRMPGALQDARRLIGDLAFDNASLGRLVETSDRIVADIAHERRPLGRLVDSAGGALDALGSRRAGLAGTVHEAPGAVAQLRSSLVALQRAADPLIPAARGLRAAAPPLAATLRELEPFTQAARPALQTVSTVAPSLRKLGRDGAPVVRRLEPLSAELSTFAQAAEPVTATFDDGIADLLGMIEGWARATQNRDGLGHVFRLGATLSPGVVQALLKSYIAPATRHSTRRPRSHAPVAVLPGERPAAQSPSPTVPALKLPAVQVPQLRIPLKLPPLKLPGAGTQTRSGDQNSVKRLLDYLLK